MSKGVYNYYDPEYNPEVTAGNELLLSVNETSFSFVILQTETKKVLVWGMQFPESELIHPAELKDVLNAKYDNVKAVVQSNSFTLIPKDLYNEADVSQYSKFLSAKANDTILVNEFDGANYVIFKIAEDTVKNVAGYVDLKSVFFAGKVFSAIVNYEEPHKHDLYLHIEDTKLQLLFFKNDLLNFYNSYDFANPDELMYYVVLVANELGLNLDETALILSGDINLSDKKISRLTELLPNVHLNKKQLLTLPQGFLPYQILILSGLTLCESLVEN